MHLLDPHTPPEAVTRAYRPPASVRHEVAADVDRTASAVHRVRLFSATYVAKALQIDTTESCAEKTPVTS